MIRKAVKHALSRYRSAASRVIPSREENILLYRKSRMRNAADCPNLPLALLVEITSKCNLSCRMCNIHFDTRSGISMDEPLLKQTFELAGTAKTVTPFGLGEPLLRPDIGTIVGEYKSRGAYVGLTTNGMLLSREVAKGLIVNRLDQLTVSVDAADPQLFAEIRRGADLNKISANIMALNDLKKSLNSAVPALALNVVVQAKNFSQLPQLLSLARMWEISFITFSPITVHSHIHDIQHESLQPVPDNWSETLELCRREAESGGVSLDMQRLLYILNGRPPLELYDGILPCPEPFRFMGVRANGDIFPCCNWDVNDPIASTADTGSADVKQLQEAWHNPQWQSLREMIIQNRYPEHCKKCMTNFTRPFFDDCLS